MEEALSADLKIGWTWCNVCCLLAVACILYVILRAVLFFGRARLTAGFEDRMDIHKQKMTAALLYLLVGCCEVRCCRSWP